MKTPPRQSTLTPGQVIEIRRLYGAGWSQGRLAREFPVGIAQVGKIVRMEAWKHLPETPVTEAQINLEARGLFERLAAEGLVPQPPVVEGDGSGLDRLNREAAKAKESDKTIEELINKEL